MSKKHSFKYVKQYFEEQGCELLETEYIGSHHKMKYRCNCGNISEICFSKFQMGRRCQKCGGKKRAEKLKHTFEYVYNYFKEQGCELLETEYVNSRTLMKYKCSCNNISFICFNKFQQGQKCNKCERMRLSKKLSYDYEYVYNYFKEQGCELLEIEYINSKTKMKYRCDCEKIKMITFEAFSKGGRCKECGIQKRAKKRKHTFEYVKQYFEEQGCELLETEYINSNHKMRYRCNCGNIAKITFSKFQMGRRCRECGSKKLSEKLKLTFEYVCNYFKEQGCELLETEYINAHHKMRYKCNCKNISEICFNSFQQGSRCKKCSGHEKLTFEYVYNYFKEQGCELLEIEYINGKTKMKYRCSCDNISKICFNSFQQGSRCKKCARNEKHTFEYAQQYFKDQGCELLETEYVNDNTKMKYRCSCNNIGYIRFNKFKIGRRCKKCGTKKQIETMIKKYGVPYFPHCGYSAESQKLFNEIYGKIDEKHKNKTYYATLNHEFGIRYKGKWFSFDYVNSKFKKVIEYNGKVWHPILSLQDNDIGWHAICKNKTVKEARDYEKIKYEGLEKRSYKILTVWDYEAKKDFDSLVQKCIDFLIS